MFTQKISKQKQSYFVLCTLALVLIVAMSSYVVLYRVPAAAAPINVLDVSIVGPDKCHVGEPTEFSAVVASGYFGGLHYAWRVENGAGDVDSRVSLVDADAEVCTVTFLEATGTEQFLLTVEVRDDVHGFGVATKTVVDPASFPNLYIGVSSATFGYKVCVDESGSYYYAINGKTLQVSLTSTNASYVINSAISSLPTQLFHTAVGDVTAQYGVVYISAGYYPIDKRIIIPAGSHITLQGAGRVYQDGDLGANGGGTLIVSFDTAGILYAPYISYMGDASLLYIRDMDFRMDVQAASTSTCCFDISGAMDGELRNVWIINDITYSGFQCNQGYGLYANFGSYNAMFNIQDVGVANFGNGSYTAVLGGEYVCDNLVLEGGNAPSNGLLLAGGGKATIGTIQFFRYGAGASVAANTRLITCAVSPYAKMNYEIGRMVTASIYPWSSQTTGFFLRGDVNCTLTIDYFYNYAATDSDLFGGVNDWVVTKMSAGQTVFHSVPGATTVSVGSSPYGLINSSPWNEFVTVAGGVVYNLTLVRLSAEVDTGLPTNSSFVLAPGDMLKIYHDNVTVPSVHVWVMP